MALYKITARRINDRPDEDGWHSSGISLPTFWVNAISAANAAAIGHDVAGHGIPELTRTFVQAYREPGSDGQPEEYVDSTQWWAGGRKVDPTEVTREYAQNGRYITGHPHAEHDADEVAWFTADGGLWLSLARTPRGLWRIDSSDYLRLRVGDYRHRFTSPDQALYLAERRSGTRVVEVDQW
jgi:hypothetical protein